MPSSMKNRIYNPVTGRYYEIRQRSSKFGQGGQKEGLWTKDPHENNEAKDMNTSPSNIRRVKVCGNCIHHTRKYRWARVDENLEFMDASVLTILFLCKKHGTEEASFLVCDDWDGDQI